MIRFLNGFNKKLKQNYNFSLEVEASSMAVMLSEIERTSLSG